MRESDRALLKERHRYTVKYLWLQAPAYFLSFFAVGFLAEVYVVSPINGIEVDNGAPIFAWIILLIAILLDVTTWGYWRSLINRGAEAGKVEPYRIELPHPDMKAVIDCLSNNIALHQEHMDDDVYYGYREMVRRDVRMFLFDMTEFQKNEFKKKAGKAVQKAIQYYGMRKQLTGQQSYRAIRINIVLIDSMTKDAQTKMETNAEHGMHYGEAILNVVIDKSKMTLYIPAYFGTWYGGSAKYYYTVKNS